jgi:hypothetical protein
MEPSGKELVLLPGNELVLSRGIVPRRFLPFLPEDLQLPLRMHRASTLAPTLSQLSAVDEFEDSSIHAGLQLLFKLLSKAS